MSKVRYNNITHEWVDDGVLEHSWGTSPEQKRREKAYNHEYYLRNKEKWAKDPNAGESRLADHVMDITSKWVERNIRANGGKVNPAVADLMSKLKNPDKLDPEVRKQLSQKFNDPRFLEVMKNGTNEQKNTAMMRIAEMVADNGKQAKVDAAKRAANTTGNMFRYTGGMLANMREMQERERSNRRVRKTTRGAVDNLRGVTDQFANRRKYEATSRVRTTTQGVTDQLIDRRKREYENHAGSVASRIGSALTKHKNRK